MSDADKNEYEARRRERQYWIRRIERMTRMEFNPTLIDVIHDIQRRELTERKKHCDG